MELAGIGRGSRTQEELFEAKITILNVYDGGEHIGLVSFPSGKAAADFYNEHKDGILKGMRYEIDEPQTPDEFLYTFREDD